MFGLMMGVMANKRTGKKLPKEWIAAMDAHKRALAAGDMAAANRHRLAMDAIASMWRGDPPSWTVKGGAA